MVAQGPPQSESVTQVSCSNSQSQSPPGTDKTSVPMVRPPVVPTSFLSLGFQPSPNYFIFLPKSVFCCLQIRALVHIRGEVFSHEWQEMNKAHELAFILY